MRVPHHPPREEIELPDVLHAFSDPVRLEIVRTLAERPDQACGDLDAPVAKSTLSHHLKVLREAGVTHTRVEGTQRLVRLRTEDLEARFPRLLDCVLEARRAAAA